jgi:hypothetical protein
VGERCNCIEADDVVLESRTSDRHDKPQWRKLVEEVSEALPPCRVAME